MWPLHTARYAQHLTVGYLPLQLPEVLGSQVQAYFVMNAYAFEALPKERQEAIIANQIFLATLKSLGIRITQCSSTQHPDPFEQSFIDEVELYINRHLHHYQFSLELVAVNVVAKYFQRSILKGKLIVSLFGKEL